MTNGCRRFQPFTLLAFTLGASFVAACGPVEDADEGVQTVQSAATSSVIKFVFVIAMENHDASQIYGNTTDAPYINNTLMAKYARATNFNFYHAKHNPFVFYQDDQVRRRLVEGEHASATGAASATTTDRSSNPPRRS